MTTLTLQVRSDPPDKPRRLRTMRRTTGHFFAAVLVVPAVLGAKTDELPHPAGWVTMYPCVPWRSGEWP